MQTTVTTTDAGLIASALRVGLEGIEDDRAAAAAEQLAEQIDAMVAIANTEDKVVTLNVGTKMDFEDHDRFDPSAFIAEQAIHDAGQDDDEGIDIETMTS